MKKKLVRSESIPEFQESLSGISEDSKIFVDKSLEIASYITRLLEYRNMKQKDLADLMGKSEAEVSKLLAGMHNFTLRSLAKIEAALGEPVICIPSKQKFVFKVNERSGITSITTAINRKLPEIDQLVYTKSKVINMFNPEAQTAGVSAI